MMSAGFVAEQSCGARLGHGTFVGATKGRGIVRAVLHCAVGHIVVRGHNAELSLAGSLFEVTIGDRPVGVGV